MNQVTVGEAETVVRRVRPSARKRLVCTALLAALFGAAGCQTAPHPDGDGGASVAPPSSGPSGQTATASPSPSWTGVPAPPEALAVYDAMWEDIMAVAATDDFKNPRIATHMRYQPLTVWTQELANRSGQGVVARGRLVWHPRVTSVTPSDNPSRVEVADCLDTANWLKYKQDGTPVDNKPGGHRRSASAITRDSDGKWYVTEQLVGDVGTCD